ncbi:MAG: hypothetical protein RL591_1418 [Planctomycetota bacterium]|jgi:hypothetical protein
MRPLFVDPKRIASAVTSVPERARMTDLAKIATLVQTSDSRFDALSGASSGALSGAPTGARRESNEKHEASRGGRSIVMRACVAPRVRRDALVAVMREPSQLPSLATARLVAGLRARGDAVRVVELREREFADKLLRETVTEPSVLQHSADHARVCVLAVDANDHVHALRVDAATNPARLGCGLVPDFTDQTFAETRSLPIAASGVAGERRPIAAVLHDVREYVRRYAMPNLIFVDDALNNEDNTFAALVESIQEHATGVQWTCSVRVGSGDSDGLSRRLMRRAAIAGLRGIFLRATDERSSVRTCELEKYAREAGVATKSAGEAESSRLVAVASRVHAASRSFEQSMPPTTAEFQSSTISPDCIPLKD